MDRKTRRPAIKKIPVEVRPIDIKPNLRCFGILSDRQPMRTYMADRQRPLISLEKFIDPKNDSLVKACQAAKRGSKLSRPEKREVMDAIGKVNVSNPISNVLLQKIARAENLPKRIRQAAKDRFVV